MGYASDRPDGGEWHENPYVGLGVDDVAMAGRETEGPPPLNLSDAPNSTIRPPRGEKGITGYGQQMIKACGFLMAERWPLHRKTFGTVTLPPMSQAERAQVVGQWAGLTRELLRWLSRRLVAQGLPSVVCSVTEVQPKRLQQTGEGYLHFHILWLNQPGRKGNWAIDPCDVRTWVDSWLQRHIPSYQGAHVNVNVKPVEGEPARYMAKYMSKGRQQVSEAMKDWGEGVCPRTWWNMTKPARDLVKRETYKGRDVGELLESILNHAWETEIDSHFDYLRHIEIDFDGIAITVGWRGRFVKGLDRDVREILQSGTNARLGSQ